MSGAGLGLVVTVPLPGARFRAGQTVRIVAGGSDTFDPRFADRVGTVEALVFDDPIRQYPDDPLIQVRVPGVGRDLFFPDELRPDARQRARRRTEPRAPSLSSPPGRL